MKQTDTSEAVGPSHGCCWMTASSDLNGKKRLKMMPERIFLMQSKITLTWKDGSLLDCALLVIRWWSCEMVTEAIVGIVFVLKKKIFSLNKS